jgi:hypothetical protein
MSPRRPPDRPLRHFPASRVCLPILLALAGLFLVAGFGPLRDSFFHQGSSLAGWPVGSILRAETAPTETSDGDPEEEPTFEFPPDQASSAASAVVPPSDPVQVGAFDPTSAVASASAFASATPSASSPPFVSVPSSAIGFPPASGTPSGIPSDPLSISIPDTPSHSASHSASASVASSAQEGVPGSVIESLPEVLVEPVLDALADPVLGEAGSVSSPPAVTPSLPALFPDPIRGVGTLTVVIESVQERTPRQRSILATRAEIWLRDRRLASLMKGEPGVAEARHRRTFSFPPLSLPAGYHFLTLRVYAEGWVSRDKKWKGLTVQVGVHPGQTTTLIRNVPFHVW